MLVVIVTQSNKDEDALTWLGCTRVKEVGDEKNNFPISLWSNSVSLFLYSFISFLSVSLFHIVLMPLHIESSISSLFFAFFAFSAEDLLLLLLWFFSAFALIFFCFGSDLVLVWFSCSFDLIWFDLIGFSVRFNH